MLSNCLLIHNNNSIYKNIIDNKIEFTYENKESEDLDHYITNTIIPLINDESFDTIIIKDILSDYPIDYYSLILSMHIRMSTSLQNKRFLPIIIESDLPLNIHLKLHPFSSIFSTPSTYLLSNKDKLEDKLQEISENTKLEEINFKELFLDKISIKLPKDYLTSHSISNEWSIYKWSSITKISKELIQDVIQKTESMLYFKYLKNKFEIEKESQDNEIIFNITGNVKVLYIDDECHKGWDSIFKKLFENITYEAIGHDFKSKTQEEILLTTQTKIKSFKPDIVILDLRLTDSDFEDIHPEDLTGSKILLANKTFNQGIQHIMFTATSRSIYLNYLNTQGIVGYIKKESPSDKIISTIDNISNFNVLINKAIKNKYLIEVYNLKTEMNYKLNTTLLDINQEDIEILKVNIDFIFSVLSSDANNKLNYAMISIFKCLETIKDALTEIRNKKVYLKDNGNRRTMHSTLNYGIDGYQGTRNRLHIILKDKFGFTETSDEYKEVDYIVDVRNPYIHPKTPAEYTNTIESGIIIWIKLLKVFIDKIQ